MESQVAGAESGRKPFGGLVEGLRTPDVLK